MQEAMVGEIEIMVVIDIWLSLKFRVNSIY